MSCSSAGSAVDGGWRKGSLEKSVERHKVTEEITTVESVRTRNAHEKVILDEQIIEYDPYDTNLVDIDELQISSYEGLVDDAGVSRDPSMEDIVGYLASPDHRVRQNAAAFLQHLCFRDVGMKLRARALGAVKPLVAMLSRDENALLQRSALGALRNLCYGPDVDSCKVEVSKCRGIELMARLIRLSPFDDVRDVATATLWNMSSSELLKHEILEKCLHTLVNAIIVPYSGWSPEPSEKRNPQGVFPSFFRNATGILRNCSSSGLQARQMLRSVDNLIPSLLHALQSYISSSMDNKSLENCLCLLRNLCYHLHDETRELLTRRVGQQMTNSQFGPAQVRLLWQPQLIPCYVALLRQSSNPWVLEAAAGCIQNLTAWAANLRAEVRRANGLPVIIELLRALEHEPIVRVCVNALRNLAEDPANKMFISQHAAHHLVRILPPYISQRESVARMPSSPTLSATLAAINAIVTNNEQAARYIAVFGGIERMLGIVSNQQMYSSKVVQYTSHILQQMWTFSSLHSFFRRLGFAESDFRADSRRAEELTGPNCTLLRPKADLDHSAVADYGTWTLKRDQMSATPRLVERPVQLAGSQHSLDGNSVLYATVNKPGGRTGDWVNDARMDGSPSSVQMPVTEADSWV